MVILQIDYISYSADQEFLALASVTFHTLRRVRCIRAKCAEEITGMRDWERRICGQ